MRTRAFFYVAAGIFLLTLSFHLGARSAGAQGGSSVSGFAIFNRYDGGPGPGLYVLTSNGDLYFNSLDQFGFGMSTRLVGNFWSGPTPVQHESFGSLKVRYRGERGAAKPTPQDR